MLWLILSHPDHEILTRDARQNPPLCEPTSVRILSLILQPIRVHPPAAVASHFGNQNEGRCTKAPRAARCYVRLESPWNAPTVKSAAVKRASLRNCSAR
jgi:hypothetical protein